MVNNKNHSGVALIQVLLLTTLLMMMALHFALSSRQQVQVATLLDDKLQAELKLRSVESELLFALLTLSKSEGFAAQTRQHPIGNIWNFYNTPFYPQPDVMVRLQDMNGLVSLYAMRQREFLAPVLAALGLDDSTQKQALQTLQQWQSQRPQFGQPDGQRHNFLPHFSEIRSLLPLTEQQYQQATQVLTNFPTFQFNPHHAPDELLVMLYGQKMAQQLATARNERRVSANSFIQLARIDEEDESLTFSTGATFRVTLQASHGEAVAKKSFICYIRDQSRTPIIWIQ